MFSLLLTITTLTKKLMNLEKQILTKRIEIHNYEPDLITPQLIKENGYEA